MVSTNYMKREHGNFDQQTQLNFLWSY